MLESEYNQCKLKIYPGNSLRVPCDLLVLFEAKSSNHSHAYNRLFHNSPTIQAKRKDKICGVDVAYYSATGFAFKTLFVLDASESTASLGYKEMNELSSWITGLIQEKLIVTFSLNENQDVESYKALIDKMINTKKIEANLVGTMRDLKYMLGYINQSGHMLINTCINTSEAIQVFYDRLACFECKRLDPECRMSDSRLQVYCKACSPLNGAHDVNYFVRETIWSLYDMCYCEKRFHIGEKASHFNICGVCNYCCSECNFEGAQADLVHHVVNHHAKKLIDNLSRILTTQVKTEIKKQCKECGTFFEQSSFCQPCFKRNNSNS